MRPLRLILVLLLFVPVTWSRDGLAGEGSNGCSRAHARQLVHDFIDAYNHGGFALLDRLVATEPEFAFFRVSPERPSPLAEDRSTLLPYFRDRHDLGDHLKLVEFRLNKKRGPSPSKIWGFALEVRRTSDDVMPWANATFIGKGAADCTIVAWNVHWP